MQRVALWFRICLFRYPLLILIYITTFLGATGDDVAIPFSNIVVAMLLIVIPASIGMLAASKCPTAARVIERLGSILGGVFLVISIYWGSKDNGDIFDISKYTALWVVAGQIHSQNQIRVMRAVVL